MKAAAMLSALISTAFFAGADVLWSAGQADNDTADVALGPGGYQGFQDDAYFIVGRSSAEKDWPYVQPGPIDAWGGSRPHTYTIAWFFGELCGEKGADLVGCSDERHHPLREFAGFKSALED
jgi:hypothetical protein